MNSNFNSIIKSKTPVLIDFYADWCEICKMLAPILKEAKSELKDNIKIIKIDVDKNQNLAKQYQVRGVPTMILFKDEKPVWQQSGVLQKQDIINIINQHS
ncbi:thioredoxin [Flavobacterium sp. CS20]|uniref:thioredoxin n=1 Tax=Flavobacterium sp. CS20 TaxID=2775246 RepID=UPI001B3A057F|nr:thioredoxin [Flavobacterium sp. CS20]QTY26788.1 thioredoxin [Flavobacterium sp. CS20]